MPSEYGMDDLPNPENENVELRNVPERTVAVIVFSGRANDAKAEKQWQELSAKLSAEGINVTGQPLLNQYNPPWTLPFLRRNEVMVEIETASLPTLADRDTSINED
ncbi:MAG: heme-binding protein, partial [Halieaceae bacterium]